MPDRSISPARAVAFDVLTQVAEGQYASDLLLYQSAKLDPRDAGLASQIVFGCLRYRAQLDYLITRHARRPAHDLDPGILTALRMGVFQLRYLDRVPPHAAVNETVEQAKKSNRRASGLVNAVLRKVNRAEVRWPTREIEYSCPEWLLNRWTAHFGKQQAEAIAKAALDEPKRYIRMPSGSEAPAELNAEPTELPGCYLIDKGLLVPGMRLHDIGSQSVVPLLDLKPGCSYLDLCAAPGNKTMQALEVQLTPAIACDISPRRIRDIPPVCPRVVLDATQPLPFRRSFDRIFIDAPCTGTGTIGRNPEIKWRVQAQDLAVAAERQAQILAQALVLLAPGGRLVYATCSLEMEENEGIVKLITKATATPVRLEREVWRLPGRDAGDGFYAAVILSEKSAAGSR